jgi:hypothetical protein
MAAARRENSASSLPTQVTRALEYVRSVGLRPASSAAWRTRSNCSALSSGEPKGMLNSSAYRPASRGVSFFPMPPTITGTRAWAGLGSAGDSSSR